MDCEHSRELMSAYLDDELSAADRQQVQAHRADCAVCRAELAELEAVRGRVATEAQRYSAPDHLKRRIQAALQAERQVMPHPARRASAPSQGPRGWPWAWINLGLAGAATAAFAVTLMLYLGQPSATELTEQELVASHYRALMTPDHLADVVSTDQHTVKPWFAGKLDFSPPVVDLAAEGFALAGGRLDYLDGRAVAALVYRSGPHVINLFVWPAPAGEASGPGFTTRQGFNLLHWRQGGMQAWAVSDLNPVELRGFAALMQARMPPGRG
jgi:anti-sigma factor RsiW